MGRDFDEGGPARIGLKGIEDLGGGYKTFFVLESGFQPGTDRFRRSRYRSGCSPVGIWYTRRKTSLEIAA